MPLQAVKKVPKVLKVLRVLKVTRVSTVRAAPQVRLKLFNCQLRWLYTAGLLTYRSECSAFPALAVDS